MLTKLLLVISVSLLFLAMTACAPSHRKDDESPKNPESPRPLYLGDLDKKLGEIYNPENEFNFDPCDLKNREKILELARTLEEKRAEIEQFSKTAPPAPDKTYVELGKFKFIDDSNVPVGEDKWISKSRSWHDVFSFYDKIKTWPIDDNWVNLNRFARGFVFDDEDRIVYLRFAGLTRDVGPKLEAIESKIQDCLTDISCLDPKLDANQKNFLNSNLAFNYYFKTLDNNDKTYEEKRDILKRFLSRIKQGNSRYAFHWNDGARVEANTLIVPMDLSVLGDASAKFIDLIEKFWNVDTEKNIKIETKTDRNTSYLLKVDEILGGRAFVSHEKANGLMQLFNLSRIKTAAHEFGHIIGLTDQYYTTWDTTHCSYVGESNGGNLMSSSSSGKVLPEHWELIKKTYWKPQIAN